MADELQEIRSRIDLLDLVSQRVSLRRRGKNYTGLCPFHDDKNPSFAVTPELGRYKCWSCGEHGDIFTWVMKTQNIEFVDALKQLAEQAGVKLDRSTPGPTKEEKAERASAMEVALSFFRESLGKAKAAKEYALGRGLDQTTIDFWEIGFAPDAGEALASTLKRKGLSLAEAKELFLVAEDQSGSFYDMFRGRLMFPIRDDRGELVAFGGRLLGKGEPKYINSSDTPLYRKSKVLYGFDRARKALQKSRNGVLVEGYLDVIACHAAGIETAVASCGTALADDQVKLLKRWCDSVTILYDGDAAGLKATRRAMQMCLDAELRVRVCLLPPGSDPDSLLRAKGAAAVQQVVLNAVLPLDWEFEQLSLNGDPKSEAFWEEAIEILTRVPNQMELEKYAMRLAPLYPGLNDPIAARKAIRLEVLRRKGPARRGPTPPKHTRVKVNFGELSGSEVAVLAALLDPLLRIDAWKATSNPLWFPHDIAASAAQDLAATYPKMPEGEPKLWISKLSEDSQELFEKIAQDPRRDRITKEIVNDALRHLEHQSALRQVKQGRGSAQNDEDRSKYLEQLKRLQPPSQK